MARQSEAAPPPADRILQLVKSNDRTDMVCALCRQSKELRRSHIIPEFLYKTLYDDKHRLHVLSVIPEQSNSIEQKGLREPLLCSDCETKLSKWERYASLALQGGVKLTFRREGNLVFVSGLEFDEFRLFQLSVLWRAGISNLQFFEQVQLGPHAETLRQLLHAGNPGPPNRYGCLMFGVRHQGAAFTQVVVQPCRLRLLNHPAYRFMFGGFIWAFLVSSQDLSHPFNQALLRPNGEALFLIRGAEELQHLANFSKELVHLGRAPQP